MAGGESSIDGIGKIQARSGLEARSDVSEMYPVTSGLNPVLSPSSPCNSVLESCCPANGKSFGNSTLRLKLLFLQDLAAGFAIHR